MYKSLYPGLAASIVVFAAAALMLYAHSDLGLWSSNVERWIFSPPASLSASAFAYVVILGITRAERSWLRLASAGLLCLCIPIGTLFIAFPFLFGLGESSAGPITWIVVTAVLSLPTAAAQVAILSNRKRRIFEFLAYPITAALAITIPAASGHSSSWIGDVTLFDLWPKTLAAAPFAGLSAVAAAGASLRQLGLALIMILTPLYGLKGAIDWTQGHGWAAVVWPARVWTEFVGAEDRSRAWNLAYKRLLAGEPVCIGERRYRFDDVKIMGRGPSTSRQPDCLTSVTIEIASKALDIASVVSGPVAVQISVPRSPRQKASASTIPEIDEGDLTVTHLPYAGARVPAEQLDFVRRKLLQFIRNAQLPE